MVTGGTFRKTFLVVTGSAGVFILIFMIISTQYLTLTTNTLYRDIRAQLFTLGNYTVNVRTTTTESTASRNHTSNKTPKISTVPVIQNKSTPIQNKSTPVQNKATPIQNKATPIQNKSIPVQNKSNNFLAISSYEPIEVEDTKLSSHVLLIRNRTTEYRKPVLVKTYESCFNFSIDKPDICHPEQNIPLLLIVISGVTHRTARNAVRATWGGYASELGIPVLFLLGSTLSDIEQRNIEREDELFEDIVQENCLDTYRNMTLKTVSMMKWVSTYCSHVPFVLKTDDDMVVNIDRLLQFVRILNSTHPSIYGRLARRWRPHRVKYSKWYVSKWDYRWPVYPDFTTGPAYLFTSNVASKLYEQSLNTSFLFLEDVFMTGIVAQKVGVKRVHNRQFHNSSSTLVYRAFGMIITSHGHSPRDMRHIWFRHNLYLDDLNRGVFKGNH